MMKRITLFTLVSLLMFALAMTGASGAQKTIRINKTCASIPGLTMTQVTITEYQTLVDFEWQNTEGDYEISIYAPGNESAFVIRDKRSAKTYKLQGVEGIGYYPNKVSIKKGEVKKFTLIFDKMPYHYVSVLEEAAELIVSADYR